MDDFLFLADSYTSSQLVRAGLDALLNRLGLLCNPKKGIWTPTKVGDHLGPTIDFHNGEFPEKLRRLARQASSLLGRADSDARWLPARQLAAIVGKAKLLYLAIAPARFFLRELHNVLATRTGWGGRVRLAHRLRRDLEWWLTVPTQYNNRSIYKPIEIPYLDADSNDNECGAVVNKNPRF
jgi:hypothetical protein